MSVLRNWRSIGEKARGSAGEAAPLARLMTPITRSSTRMGRQMRPPPSPSSSSPTCATLPATPSPSGTSAPTGMSTLSPRAATTRSTPRWRSSSMMEPMLARTVRIVRSSTRVSSCCMFGTRAASSTTSLSAPSLNTRSSSRSVEPRRSSSMRVKASPIWPISVTRPRPGMVGSAGRPGSPGPASALASLLVMPAVARGQSLDEREFATLLGQAGQAYEEGRYAEAETLIQRGLRVALRFGPGDLRVGLAQRNLALLYRMQGRFAEAETQIRAARAIFDAGRGPDDLETAAIVNILGTVREDRGFVREAEGLYKQALSIREKYLDPDHPDIAWSLNNLAMNYRSQRRYGEAEGLLARALKIWERALGPEHPRVATAPEDRT